MSTTSKPDDPAAEYVAPEPELQPGDQVGEYVVDGKIGEGGFGAVFKATHPLIGKQVAIKVLNRQFSSNPQMVSRFIAEARAVNQIRHRHIIDIFSFGQLPDGRQYYVMELLAGEPLDRMLAAKGRLAMPEAVVILRAVARALDAAHQKGIAHRDLKPENIFVSHDEDGTPYPKLLDFGIAKLLGGDAPHQHKTRTGAPMGTPYYMSPEQCRGRDVDHRTDIYSFGIVAYQLLTGKLPFDGEDFMDILLKQLQEQARSPSSVEPALPAACDKPILWMMEKDPGHRPPNLVTAVRALEDAAAEAGVVVPGGGTNVFEAQRASGVVSVPSTTPAPGSGRTPAPRGGTPAPRAGTPAPASAVSPHGPTMMTDALAAPARGNRAGLIIAIAGLLLAGGGLAAYLMKGRDGAKPAASAAPGPTTSTPTPPSPPPAPTASVAADAAPAAVAPPPSADITLDVRGVPDGTEVVGPDGAVLGHAPGTIKLPRGDAALALTFRAKGYEPLVEKVTPAADATLEPKLHRKAAGGKHGSGGKKPGKDDLEDFGK